MYSRQIEQVARQRNAELTAPPRSPVSPARTAGHARNGSIRSHAGWAIVALGLRIAESGTH
jgi:hypothetical protein